MSLRGAVLAGGLLLAGCGADAALVLRLAYVEGDDPFRDAATFAVEVKRGDEVLADVSRAIEGDPADGDPLRLPELPRVAGMEILLWGRDASSTVVSSGSARPDIPERGGRCCVSLCFCSVVVVEYGGCTCGSNSCTDAC